MSGVYRRRVYSSGTILRRQTVHDSCLHYSRENHQGVTLMVLAVNNRDQMQYTAHFAGFFSGTFGAAMPFIADAVFIFLAWLNLFVLMRR